MRTVPPPLSALAGLVDQATRHHRGHVLVHVDGPLREGGEVDLAVRPLPPGAHPFDVLAGCTAPVGWSVFGIRVTGRARHLDRPTAAAEAMTTTFVVDRQGREASCLRTASGAQDLTGPAEGTVPDLCRRVLGLPTAPPPPTTTLLWVVQWLDRILDQWGQPHRRRDLRAGWGRVAILHPAIEAPTELDLGWLADPQSLLPIARAHAATWPWAELRQADRPLDLPDGPLDPAVARWMDDGFFARWTIGAHPSPVDTLRTLCPLLGEPVGRQLRSTVLALLA